MKHNDIVLMTDSKRKLKELFDSYNKGKQERIIKH